MRALGHGVQSRDLSGSVYGLGFRGLGFRGRGFRDLGFRDLGLRDLGFRDLGFRDLWLRVYVLVFMDIGFGVGMQKRDGEDGLRVNSSFHI